MVTVKELNMKCKKLGLKGYTRLSKADLLKLVAKHEKKSKPQKKEKCWKTNCNKNAVYKRIIERNPLPICQSCYDDEKRRLGGAAIRAYVPLKEYKQWKLKQREKLEFNKRGELRKARKVKPKVKLVGTDGNAYAIIGKVRKALIRAGLRDEAEKFVKEATSGDYDNVLRTAMKYADVY